jgi:hypothetical protein
VQNVCVFVCKHTHISDCVEIVYELPLLPNSNNNFTQSGTVRNVDWIIYHLVSGVAVTGRIRDIGSLKLPYLVLTSSHRHAKEYLRNL